MDVPTESGMRQRPIIHALHINVEGGPPVNINGLRPTGEATAYLSALSDLFNLKAAAAVLNMILLATLLGKMRYYNHNQSWCSYIFFGCLFSYLALSLYLRKRTREISEQEYIPASHMHWVQRLKWPCTMAYLSTVLQMVAVAALLVLYDTVYLTVACPLLLLIVALLVSLIWRATAGAGLSGIAEGASNYWVDDFKTGLNDLFKLSSQAVSMGISGLLGTVLAYVKSAPAGQGRPGIATAGYRSPGPECFMLYGIVLALLVVLLSSVPPAVGHPSSKPNVVNVYLRVPAYAALLFLVAACVMAAEAILHEFVFFGFFVVATVAVLCYQKEHRDGPSEGAAQGRVASLEGVAVPESFSQFLFSFYHVPSFAVLMASYAKYGGADTTHTSELFKWFVFAGLCSILTNVSRMVVSAEEKGMESMWFPKKAWTYATYVTTAVACLLLYCVVRLHPNDLLNIIL